MKNRQNGFSFQKNIFVVGLVITAILLGSEVFATPIFINEIHYENDGGDTGEAVEIAGPAGTDLTGWRIAFYRGSNGTRYNSYINISASIPDQSGGFGTLAFFISGIRNSTGGIALLDSTDTVIQFLSYEGALTATDGPALGTSSTNIGVFESSNTPVGYSLQLFGSGNTYEDFSWAVPGSATFGTINTGQSFTLVPTPEPGTFALMGLGLMGMLLFFRYKRVRIG